jgi:hypothetical protein
MAILAANNTGPRLLTRRRIFIGVIGLPEAKLGKEPIELRPQSRRVLIWPGCHGVRVKDQGLIDQPVEDLFAFESSSLCFRQKALSLYEVALATPFGFFILEIERVAPFVAEVTWSRRQG